MGGTKKKLSRCMGQVKILHLLTISDTHFGSDVALMPPAGSFKLHDQALNTQNPLQKIMWDLFQDHLQKALATINGEPFLLILNGDLTEGIHHRSDEISSAKLDDQHRAAKYALFPVAQAANASGGGVVLTMGTDCHTLRGEHSIGQQLGALPPKDTDGLYAFDGVDIMVNGFRVNASHHMPTTSRAYLEASGLGITLQNGVLQRARDGHPIPDIFLKAHRHTAGYYSDGRRLIAVQGAYQFKTRHGNKVVPESGTWPSMTVLSFGLGEYRQLPTVRMFGTAVTQTETLTI